MIRATQQPWLRHYPPEVRPHLEYEAVPLYTLLDRKAAEQPASTAMSFMGRTFPYAWLVEQTKRMASALAGLGVGKGDRVAIMMPNCPQYVIAYYGILRAGGIVAQVSPLSVEREISYLVRNAGARIIATVDALYPRIRAVAAQGDLDLALVATLTGDPGEKGPEFRSFEQTLAAGAPEPPSVTIDPRQDVAVLQYTGGTTGVSKGAMLTHFNLVANVTQIDEWFRGDPARGTEQQRILTVLPLFHVYGMTVCMNYGLATGAELILLPRFEIQQVLEAIRDRKPTSFPGVPTMYVAVNSHPEADRYGIDSIRYCNSGGAPMPAEVMSEFERRFGARLLEGYGLSETSPVTHCNPISGLRKPGSIGLPYPDTDAEVVDVETGTRVLPPGSIGELRIRGPQVMKGYWQMPDETAQALRDGWLYTGDIARMDEDGYFFIVDRKKDMIIVSGYNVYPREVEEVLYEHPAIAEACVAGLPDPYQGELVKAYLVLKPGHSLTREELDAYCRGKLAAYKVPREVEFRESLPKSAVGKVLRRALLEEEKARRAREA